MKLCVITTQNERFSHEDVARFAVEGGADCVQFRKKDGKTRELFDIAERIKKIVSGRATYIINDHVDIALGCGADGVHVGEDDMPLDVARRICPKGFVIGYSVDSVEKAILAEMSGASYLGAGAVFATTNKPEKKPIGLEELRRICRSVSIPVIAIGGIGLGNVREVMDAGASGVAVISAIADSKKPVERVRQLMSAIER